MMPELLKECLGKMDPVQIWVYGSTLLEPDWCAWECIAPTKSGLERKCIEEYGRIPGDCVAKQINIDVIPERYVHQLFDIRVTTNGELTWGLKQEYL